VPSGRAIRGPDGPVGHGLDRRRVPTEHGRKCPEMSVSGRLAMSVLSDFQICQSRLSVCDPNVYRIYNPQGLTSTQDVWMQRTSRSHHTCLALIRLGPKMGS
jgi:hypothetical protein